MPSTTRGKNLKVTVSREIDEALHDHLSRWSELHRDQAMQAVIRAGLELFLSLPDPMQGILLTCKRGDPVYLQVAEAVSAAVVSVDFPWHSMTCEALVKLRRYLEETLSGDADMVRAEDLKAALDESAAAREASEIARKLRPDKEL